MKRYIHASSATKIFDLSVGSRFESDGTVFQVTDKITRGTDGHYVVPTDKGDITFDANDTVITDIRLKRFVIMYTSPGIPDVIFQSVTAYDEDSAIAELKQSTKVNSIVGVRPVSFTY